MAGTQDWNALLATLSAKLSAENEEVLILQDEVDEITEKQDPITAQLKEVIAIAYSTPGQLDEFGNYVDEFGFSAHSPDEIQNAHVKMLELQPINETYSSAIDKMNAVIRSKIVGIKEIGEQIERVKLAILHEKKAREDAEKEIEERARQAEEARRIEEESIRQAEEQVRRLEEEERATQIQTPPQRQRISMQRPSKSRTPQTPTILQPQKKRSREDAIEESIEETENAKPTKKQNATQDKEFTTTSISKRKRDTAFVTEDKEQPQPKKQAISIIEDEPIVEAQRRIEIIEEPIETQSAPKITKINEAPLTTIQPPVQWDSEPLPSVEPIHTKTNPLDIVDLQPSGKVFGILLSFFKKLT
jgi:hypothetical protein